MKLRLIDMNGRLIRSATISDNVHLHWDTSQLVSGTYILYIEDENGMYTEKVVKQ